MGNESNSTTLTSLLKPSSLSSPNNNGGHLNANNNNNHVLTPLVNSTNGQLNYNDSNNIDSSFASLLSDTETSSSLGDHCSTNPSMLQNALQNNHMEPQRRIKKENSVAASNPLLAGKRLLGNTYRRMQKD